MCIVHMVFMLAVVKRMAQVYLASDEEHGCTISVPLGHDSLYVRCMHVDLLLFFLLFATLATAAVHFFLLFPQYFAVPYTNG